MSWSYPMTYRAPLSFGVSSLSPLQSRSVPPSVRGSFMRAYLIKPLTKKIKGTNHGLRARRRYWGNMHPYPPKTRISYRAREISPRAMEVPHA